MDPDWAPCERCDCVDGVNPIPRFGVRGEPVFLEDGEYVRDTRQCPRRLVTPESRHLLSLFRHYRAGHLYESGGVAAQPARYLSAMELIDSVLNSGDER